MSALIRSCLVSRAKVIHAAQKLQQELAGSAEQSAAAASSSDGAIDLFYRCAIDLSMPAFASAKFAFSNIGRSRAERPANTNPWVKLAFYNIGWNPASKKALVEVVLNGLTCTICSIGLDSGQILMQIT